MPQHILVIDDHPETLRFVSFILQRYGYEVTVVEEGLEGIKAAERQRPDLIMLDVMMPGVDGYEVCRRFRAHPELAGIPIIMFTAKNQIAEKWAGFKAGVDDYLVKPTEPEELAARIEALLARSAPLPEATPPQSVASLGHGHLPEFGAQPPSRPLPRKTPEVECHVAVIGSRGGAGATIVAVNLAATLAGQNRQTVLIDLDMDQGHIAMYLNQVVKEGLNQLICVEEPQLPEALARNVVQYRQNLEVLLARPNLDCHLPVLSTDQAATMVKVLKKPGRSIVADVGSGKARFGPKLLRQFSHVLVCLHPDRVGMWATQLLLKQLQQQLPPTTALHALILDFRDGAHLPMGAVAEFLRHPVTAAIPLVKAELAQAVNRGQLLVDAKPDSEATAVFCRLARLLAQETAARQELELSGTGIESA
jgi:CheY-like chemotaxis protein/MinD-like ATPase involved in chromosome partitioning or flagellar assembly